ncbi:MAG: ACT domain-containing protein, partial [Nitrospinota bacterium]
THASFAAREISRDDNVAKVSIVGIGMKSQAGVASRTFAALARDRINIMMISTSEISISVIVREDHADDAVRALHREFMA